VEQAVSIGNEDLWFCHQTLLIRTAIANPAYGAESAPMKVHYPTAVDSIADDSSPWRSAPMACHATGHQRHC
jgi:hypothetical protein